MEELRLTHFEAARGVSATPEALEALSGHLVNLRFGSFSSGGSARTRQEDVDWIFHEHLPRELEARRAAGQKLRLLFYAHGGLTAENHGLAGALDQLGFYRANGIWPIFFVWETGLLETLADLMIESLPGARGFVDALTDPLIEGVTSSAGTEIWSRMKRSAEVASQSGGGALYVAKRTADFFRLHDRDVEIHAAGHSAGAIFQAHFLSALADQGVRRIHSLHLLAPAITVPLFKQRLAGLVGPTISALTMYTMDRRRELEDSVGPYRKSLLYLVNHAFETPDETPILGLEECVRADPELQQLFRFGALAGGGGAREGVLSPSDGRRAAPANRAPTAASTTTPRPWTAWCGVCSAWPTRRHRRLRRAAGARALALETAGRPDGSSHDRAGAPAPAKPRAAAPAANGLRRLNHQRLASGGACRRPPRPRRGRRARALRPQRACARGPQQARAALRDLREHQQYEPRYKLNGCGQDSGPGPTR
jgi:hypothetical protein